MSRDKIQISGNFTQVEHVLGASGLYPGMLVQVNSSDALVAHDTEGGHGEVLVLMEDVYAGKTVDDVLTDGERAQAVIPHSGAVFQGLLADGQDVAVGDTLVSAGDGTWIAESAATSASVVKQVMAVAREACDLTGSDSANTLIRMRRI